MRDASANQGSNRHSIRRIVLPSGKSVEVIRFHDASELPAPRGLHVCAECESELVQPVAWAEAHDDHWQLMLECPNCRWTDEGLFDAEQVRRLEEKLDEGVADMLRDLKRLTRANMADQIERFVDALQADLILPEDF